MFANKYQFLLSLILFHSYVQGDNNVLENFIFNNETENGLNFTEMAMKCGLTCEEHKVTTDDGYVLTIFHIPGDPGKPVFGMHGLVDSSDTFIFRGNTSIVKALAIKGYDIWVGNQRGNKYSRSHVTLDAEKNKEQFWNFTLQEIAVYDLSAMVDYVLDQTGQTQLQAFGHSQGTTVFYILGAEKPEFNDKIKLFISLSPICYLHHVKSLPQIFVKIWPLISAVNKIDGKQEALTPAELEMKTQFCSIREIGYAICAKGIIFAFAGPDPEELGPDFFYKMIKRYPDTSSLKNIEHHLQIAVRKTFAKFDYGLLGNLKQYGSIIPPEYALKNVTMPIALLVGRNDYLSTLEDVELLRKELPNVVKYHVMERKEFNHLDFVWGEHMSDYLFPLVFNLLENYPKQD